MRIKSLKLYFCFIILALPLMHSGASYGQANSLSIAVAPKAYADRSLTITIQAINVSGAIDTNYTGTATVSITGNAMAHTGDSPDTQYTATAHGSSATAYLVKGVGTVVAHGASPGDTITVSASATGLTEAVPVQITFYSSDATRFQFVDFNGRPIDYQESSLPPSGWRYGWYIETWTELGDLDTSFNGSANVLCAEEIANSSTNCDTSISFVDGESIVYIGETEFENVTVTVSDPIGFLGQGQLVVAFKDYYGVTGYSISGNVSASDGSSGSYGWARAFPAGTTDYGWENVIRSTSFYTGGPYTITDVPDGTYDILFEASGFLDHIVQDVTVSGANVTDLNAVLDRGNSISGNVFPEGVVATISAHDATTHQLVSETYTTGTNASYSVTGFQSGVYDLRVKAEGYLTDEATLRGIQVSSNAIAQDVTLIRGGSIIGKIFSTTVSYMGIALFPSGDRDHPLRTQYLYGNFSEGLNFSLAGLPAGTYDLVALLGSFKFDLETGIQVSEGVDSTEHNITFNKRQGTIIGTVTTSDSSTVDTGYVYAYPAGKDLSSWFYTSAADFTTGGYYEVWYLWPGVYNLVFKPDSEDLAVGVLFNVVVPDTETGGVSEGNDIVLERFSPGTISGTVTDALSSDPIENIRVVAYRADGYYFFSDTDMLGNFKITGLERGTYDLRVAIGGPHWMPGPSNFQPLFIDGLTVVNEGADTGGLNFALQNKAVVDLLSPANNATTSRAPSFSWEPVTGTYYLVIIKPGYTDTGAAMYEAPWEFRPLWAFQTTDTSATYGDASNGTVIMGSNITLRPNRLYLWRVFALRDPFDLSVKWEERLPTELQAFGESEERFFWLIGLECLPGDLNADGRIDILDGIAMVRIAVGLDQQPTTEDELCRGDLNGDSQVNIGDVINVLRKALGLS